MVRTGRQFLRSFPVICIFIASVIPAPASPSPAGAESPPGIKGEAVSHNSIRLTPEEADWLARHKTIRVAFDGYFPPYSFLNEDGKFEGLAVDVMNILADRIGVSIDPFPKAVWKDLYEAAQKREVDVVATMGHQPEREQWFTFTRPYIFKSLVIMTRRETTAIDGPEDLAGRRVAMVKSYQYVKPLLEKYPSITPYYVDTMLDGLNAVAVGKADAAITFLGAGHYLKTKYQIANLKFAAVFERDRFTESIAVRRDWPGLAAILDKALDSITSEEMAALSRRWMGPEDVIGIESGTVYKYLAVILGIMLLAAAGFTGWNRSLKRQVDLKTAELQRELAERKRTEQLLTDSESKYRRLHESMMDGFGYVDMTGAIRDSNASFREMLGYSAEELGRLGYTDITPQEWHEAEKRIIAEQVLTRGYSDVYEKEYIRKDGVIIPAELRTFLVKDEVGKNEGMWAVVRDITERKKAEKELMRSQQVLRLFVENSPAAIAMFDRDMKYIVASRRFFSDYKLGDQDIIGRSHYDVFPEIPERWREIHRRCLAGAIEKSDEDPFPRADGKTDWVRWEIRPWYEAQGEVGGIILFSEVVTERRMIQTELAKYREHLEELVEERTAELAEKNAELERMNRLFVGRELRMAELKDKIARLENTLRQRGLFE